LSATAFTLTDAAHNHNELFPSLFSTVTLNTLSLNLVNVTSGDIILTVYVFTHANGLHVTVAVHTDSLLVSAVSITVLNFTLVQSALKEFVSTKSFTFVSTSFSAVNVIPSNSIYQSVHVASTSSHAVLSVLALSEQEAFTTFPFDAITLPSFTFTNFAELISDVKL
jgi:hypothetical protein